MTGDKLLTALNAGDNNEAELFAKLRLTALQGEEPLRQAQDKPQVCKAVEAV